MSLFSRFLSLYFVVIFSFSQCLADLASDTIYLTWQRDPTTTMTIQWISSPEQKNDQITFQKVGNSEWQTGEGSHFPLPHSAEYLVHRIELTNLTPQTRYRFKLTGQESEYHFCTMPTHNEQSIRFVVGGDMYHDHVNFMKETNKQAAKTNPDFALLGGDIAYAVNHWGSQNIQNWIEWIKAWHECMITPDGRLIPVLAAVGNHDVMGQFNQTPSEARVFSSLFPRPTAQIYTVLDFGSYLSLFILDSGHTHPISGMQTKWLKSALQARQEVLNKFAIYHIPAYPSVRAFTTKECALIRRYWVPLFEKEKVSLVFEHHDHAYKRTHPLLNNRVHSQGIIYVGDGAWGIESPRQPRSNKKIFYLAKFASARHFLLVTLHQQGQHVMAINSQGQILDEFSRPRPEEGLNSNQIFPTNRQTKTNGP